MTQFLRYLLVANALVWAQPVSPTINPSPSREFGQPQLLSSLNSVAPNLVEGREMTGPLAIAFDTSVTPPILYIVDSVNNRVLAFKNPAGLGVCGTGNPSCGFADLQIGQRDLTGTLVGGPGGPGLKTGFAVPTGIAVDSSGSVYVADRGNNRILRFPAPFKQTSSILVPDLIIGQQTLNSNVPNQGQNAPSAQTLALSNKISTLAIDPSGNLWVTDPGNNRVLRFPVSQLAPNTSQPTADVVLGQTDPTFSTLPAPPPNTQAALDKNILNAPIGIAFDAKGRLYISDGYNRVLYFPGPFTPSSTGTPAARILGLFVQQTPPFPNVNQYALFGPQGLASNGTNLFVSDAGNSRIVEYDVPETWKPEPTLPLKAGDQYSPPMIAAVGQVDLVSGQVNQGKPQPGANTMAEAFGIAFSGSDLWVADTLNNRVLDFPLQGSAYASATRLVGQLNFPYNAPNLIEGREVFFAGGSNASAAGVVVDQNSNPPHLYIADTYNNRILCFNDIRTVTSTSRADLVIGQSTSTDFYNALVNSGTNNPSTPTQTGLFAPVGLAIDSSGNLYVADSGNGRVLRYPSPFGQAPGAQLLPNLVLGQASFTFTDTDASNQNMHSPWGLAIFSEGSLAVSDAFHNRVLIFKRPAGGDFQNGQSAVVVLGQPDFNTVTTGNTASGMSSPRHVAVDSSDRLYVCDPGNNRLLIFTNARTSANGVSSALQLNNLSQPQGVAVSQQTGEIYIANSASGNVVRLPLYETLILNASPNSYPVTAVIATQSAPLSVALYSDKLHPEDQSDNQIFAESSNRITFFFPQLVFQNAANYNSQPMAPGMLALMYRNGLDFNLKTSYPAASPNNLALPWQGIVNDIEILVSAPGMAPTPAPIFRIDPTLIAFQVPASTPPSGIATFVVVHPSTGSIVGEGDFPMAQYSPGFFAAGNPAGTGQARAFNNDSSCTPQPDCQINGPGANAISRDGTHTISFCLTGGGVFQNSPPDGQYAAPGNTADKPQLLSGAFNGGLVPPANVTYSGAGCGFPGGWQVNYLVSNLYAPSATNVIALTIGDIPSSKGPSGTIQVTFATK